MKSNIVKMCLCAFFFIGGMIFARAMQVDYVSFKPSVGAFSLSADGRVATIVWIRRIIKEYGLRLVIWVRISEE